MAKTALIVATSLLAVCIHAQAAKKSKEITCSPKVLYTGDRLMIKTGQPFTYLGVTPPAKKAMRTLVVYPEASAVSKHSLIDADQFSNQKKVALPVNTAEAWFDTEDGGSMQPIFSKAGSYVFEVGNNLATSNDKTSFKCIVKYVTY